MHNASPLQIKSGTAVTWTSRSRVAASLVLGPGDVVGWEAAFGLPPAPATALTNVTACPTGEAVSAAALIRQLMSNHHAALTLTLVARLARWLVLIHERADTDALPLTHGQLAAMLAVRRAGVTEALHLLEGEGLVRSTRGLLVIRDRAGLEARAQG